MIWRQPGGHSMWLPASPHEAPPMDRLLDFPVALSIVLLFVVGLLRGQATYWLARAITEQTLHRSPPVIGWRAALHRWLRGDAIARGRRTVDRIGIVAVPLCYLTVGLQTVVLAGSGCLRINWYRFTAAQVPGAIAWAVIYTTVGFAVWATTIAAVAGNPIVLLACALAVVAVVLLMSIRARRSRVTARIS